MKRVYEPKVALMEEFAVKSARLASSGLIVMRTTLEQFLSASKTGSESRQAISQRSNIFSQKGEFSEQSFSRDDIGQSHR